MAAGHTLLIWTANAGRPPASNFATHDLRNAHPVLDFDDTTAETVYFGGVMPRIYDGNGLTVTLYWMASTATTGNVIWEVAFERHQQGVDDLDVDGFAAANLVVASAPALNGSLQYSEIAFTDGGQIDNLANGDSLRVLVRRAAANVSDNMTGDAELLSIELRETAP